MKEKTKSIVSWILVAIGILAVAIIIWWSFFREEKKCPEGQKWDANLGLCVPDDDGGDGWDGWNGDGNGGGPYWPDNLDIKVTKKSTIEWDFKGAVYCNYVLGKMSGTMYGGFTCWVWAIDTKGNEFKLGAIVFPTFTSAVDFLFYVGDNITGIRFYLGSVSFTGTINAEVK